MLLRAPHHEYNQSVMTIKFFHFYPGDGFRNPCFWFLKRIADIDRPHLALKRFFFEGKKKRPKYADRYIDIYLLRRMIFKDFVLRNPWSFSVCMGSLFFPKKNQNCRQCKLAVQKTGIRWYSLSISTNVFFLRRWEKTPLEMQVVNFLGIRGVYKMG